MRRINFNWLLVQRKCFSTVIPQLTPPEQVAKVINELYELKNIKVESDKRIETKRVKREVKKFFKSINVEDKTLYCNESMNQLLNRPSFIDIAQTLSFEVLEIEKELQIVVKNRLNSDFCSFLKPQNGSKFVNLFCRRFATQEYKIELFLNLMKNGVNPEYDLRNLIKENDDFLKIFFNSLSNVNEDDNIYIEEFFMNRLIDISKNKLLFSGIYSIVLKNNPNNLVEIWKKLILNIENSNEIISRKMLFDVKFEKSDILFNTLKLEFNDFYFFKLLKILLKEPSKLFIIKIYNYLEEREREEEEFMIKLIKLNQNVMISFLTQLIKITNKCFKNKEELNEIEMFFKLNKYLKNKEICEILEQTEEGKTLKKLLESI